MRPTPADLASLATLDALLQTSSVTRAADRLGLSVPAVSHALAKLRLRFDDPLLVRAGRGMVLNPRAEALAPRVRATVAAGERVCVEPRRVRSRSAPKGKSWAGFANSEEQFADSFVGQRIQPFWIEAEAATCPRPTSSSSRPSARSRCAVAT